MPDELIQVIAAVVVRDGRYLICRRPVHKRHGGLWEFPGGKLEEGEKWLEAARRELAEELHLSVEAVGAVRFKSQDPGSAFVVNFVTVEVGVADQPIPTEHTAVRWATVEELSVMDLAPSDRLFVKYLEDTDNKTRSI